MTGYSTNSRPALSRRIYTQRPGFTLGIVFGAMGLIIAAVCAWFLYEATALDRSGVDTSAVVTDRHITHSHSHRGGTRTSYHVGVRFDDLGGVTREADFTVSRGFYDTTRPSRPVRLRYVPDRPWIAEIEPGRDWRLAAVLGTLAGGFLFAALVSGWVTFRQAASRRRALLDGEARRATVTQIKPYGRKSARTARMHWRDAAGTTGLSPPLRLDRLPAAGTEVTVFVDPRRGVGYWSGEY